MAYMTKILCNEMVRRNKWKKSMCAICTMKIKKETDKWCNEMRIKNEQITMCDCKRKNDVV